MAKQLKGDINNDGRINMIDVYLTLRAGSDSSLFYPEELERADVNSDGSVTAVDARTIIQHISATNLIDEAIE